MCTTGTNTPWDRAVIAQVAGRAISDSWFTVRPSLTGFPVDWGYGLPQVPDGMFFRVLYGCCRAYAYDVPRDMKVDDPVQSSHNSIVRMGYCGQGDVPGGEQS